MFILPSLAAANPLCYQSEIEKIKPYGVLHIDIEDGVFVPNITFGLKTIQKVINTFPELLYDVHLMVDRPSEYIDPLADMGVRAISFHLENVMYPRRILAQMKKHQLICGMAINPKTEVESLYYCLPELDYVLLMSCEPDLWGEAFLPNVLGKVKKLRQVNPSLLVIVDGGIKAELLKLLEEVGVDMVIMGRAVFQAKEPLSLLREHCSGLPALWR
ncbi:MAG: ribulose-phosphate 3-epimerase [Erysipelotrichaceae bacterium]|jgi:ribulose-phosphate 3-epimerase|nr:ribulose-phosphate 3-epimerase [Erysipelotrichaceae bacterium]